MKKIDCKRVANTVIDQSNVTKVPAELGQKLEADPIIESFTEAPNRDHFLPSVFNSNHEQRVERTIREKGKMFGQLETR